MSLKELVEYNVKKYREEKNISQKELSIMIGKTEDFIENLENGKYTKALNFRTLFLISQAVGIDIQDLFIETK